TVLGVPKHPLLAKVKRSTRRRLDFLLDVWWFGIHTAGISATRPTRLDFLPGYNILDLRVSSVVTPDAICVQVGEKTETRTEHQNALTGWWEAVSHIEEPFGHRVRSLRPIRVRHDGSVSAIPKQNSTIKYFRLPIVRNFPV